MQTADIQVIKDIPGYKVILKAVLKTQIQQLVEQLAENTGEESVILTASVSDGTLSHLGSDSGKVFLEDHDDIKTQFLGFCLKRHHRQKQIEKEKQEQLERQRESESLMQASARIMNVPTTPTRFTGMRPRFTPTRLQTSPRQPQFSPRFQTSPRQSFGSASPGGRIQSSPRLQSVPLSGINNVRHEPYPQNRPRRTSLNFNQQGRSPNPNLSQKPPSTMRLPTEPQKVKKINIDPNEVIKIEAADDEEEEVQQKSKTKQSVKRPESTSSETGIKIASVTGATETNVKLDTASSGTATKTIETSEAPLLSSAPSPATPTLAISSSNMPVLSPIPKDESSNSSASTITNEPVSGKVIDIVPPDGLSLDSDLSNLTGIPAETKTEEKSNSSSAASSVVASASQDSDSGTEPTVSVKVEALTESEMDLEITGIEPGQVAPRALNVQSRMESGPSTSGMEEGMGSQMNPEYNALMSQATQFVASIFGEKAASVTESKSTLGEQDFMPLDLAASKVKQEADTLALSNALFGYKAPHLFPLHLTHAEPMPRFSTSAESVVTDSRWKCDDCGKCLQTKYALEMHRRTHTGEKPYGCDVCGMRFNVKGNLKRHYLTHISL